MIVCSCAVLSDADIEGALIDILNQENAPLPTPGIVFRHLKKKMNCCGCAPLTVEMIYAKMTTLERRGLICPYAGANVRGKLLRLVPREKVAQTNTQGLPLAV